MDAVSPTPPSYAEVAVGDPMPYVLRRTPSSPLFAYDSLAGRYLVLCFYGSAATPLGASAVAAMARHRATFDDQRASCFGVSTDPQDETQGRVKESLPGVRFLWDFDGRLSRQCGALPKEEPSEAAAGIRQFWIILDPSLHVLAKVPFAQGDSSHEAVFKLLAGLPDPARFAGFEIPAPVLILPHVFEPNLCRHLIKLYDDDGGAETGIMRNGAAVIDRTAKSRRDYTVVDPALIAGIQARIRRRVVPEISRIFFMTVTRMERYIVGAYAAQDGGHFRPHRDNTQPITAHRRFAVSVNLNRDFEGGEIRFPEYSLRGYKAPPGWAVVFPCNVLHAVSEVQTGTRYAFLPFVYDEAGSKIRSDYVKNEQGQSSGNGDARQI